MKKFNLLLLISLLICACTGFKTSGSNNECDSTSIDEPLLTFDSISYHQVKYVNPEKQIPSIKLDFDITYAASQGEVPERINRRLVSFLFGKEGSRVEDAMTAFIDSLTSEYSHDLAEFYDEDDEMTSSYEYEHELKGRLSNKAHDHTIVYEYSGYTYLGGAHGASCIQYVNFNSTTGMEIKLSDLFNDEDKKTLLGIIRNKLVSDNNCKTYKELTEKTSIGLLGDVDAYDGNFALLREGILFVYNQYEIAPYSEGIITIIVPYESLKGILKTSVFNI